MDSKSTALPLLPKTPPATIVLSTISASALTQVPPATKSTSAPSTPAQRSIPTDPKELVKFLLNDDKTDKKAREILKKVVLSHSTKLIKDQKQTSTVQLASKPNLTTSITAKQQPQSTKLLTTKPVMVAQPAKPSVPVTVGVVKSVSKSRVVSSVTAVPSIEAVGSKSSPPKTTSITLAGNTTSPRATQSSVVKTGSGIPGLVTTHATVPSQPKAEKKKETKKKLTKDSPSLSATLTNMGTVKNTALKTAGGSSNPPHMLTSTAELLPYITSGGNASIIRVVSKAAGGSQSVQPTTAVPTAIITTPDGRVLVTGASQPQVSITQAGLSSGKSISNQSSKGAKSGGAVGEGGITGLLKKNGSADAASSKSVVGGALSLSPRQQQASLKTMPVIQISRLSPVSSLRSSASASTGSTQPASNSNAAVSVTKNAPLPPLPSLSLATSIKDTVLGEEASIPHPQPGKTVVASSQSLKQLKLETASGVDQQEKTLKLKKTAVVVNNNQQTVLKPVTTTVVPPVQTVMPLTGTTIAQVISQITPGAISIPSLPKLVASSKPVGHPVVQQLPLTRALPDTTNTANVARDMPPLTGVIDSLSHKVVPETPPLSTTHWKESSPLKSPVEQIMEEHSYLGSTPPVQPAGQSPWQLQFVHTSSPQQQLSGENVLQAQFVPKGPNTNTKDM